jgi:uncharacterized protein with HEPN domain
MTRSDEQRITDILEYADKIELAVQRGYEAFKSDEFIGPAIERFIEILGEAARQLTAECKSKYPNVNWVEIIGLRTRLAHIYHRIDVENIWETATKDVPNLAREIRNS